MLGNKLINTNAGGGCTNTVDLYNPFPDGGGVALYQLNGDATDVSGNYDGTASNVTYGAGEFGQAGVFNGSSSGINTPIPFLNAKATSSVSLWVKYTDTTAYKTLFQDWSSNNNWNHNIIANWPSTGNLRFFSAYGGSGGYVTFETSGLTLNDGNWHNIVGVLDASTRTYKGYVDGVEVGSMTVSSNAWTGVTQNANIGNENGSANFFNGSIDQVRIFSRALRPYEVEALYTEEYCTPTIVPSEHFNTVTYTGTGSTGTQIPVGFQPDFVWFKNRSDTDWHILQDSVRGVDKSLFSNAVDAEETYANFIQQLNATGYTIGSDGQINQSGLPYVSWNFKAGGAAVTNTDGTITSQVSANTEAGFSVVSYTGNGAATNNTVGHGLGSIPKMIIIKQRSGTTPWIVYHSEVGTGDIMELNQTYAASGSGPILGYPTDVGVSPTNSVYTIGANNSVNASSQSYIAYCFAEVEGFSNFGSYVGNLSSQTNIVTGFEPAFVIIKCSSGFNSGRWFMWDNKRSPSNINQKVFFADLATAEEDNIVFGLNFLENGFSIPTTTTSNSVNQTGYTYIYMAFAADPTAVEPSLEDSFNTVLFTGNGSATQAITGVGFQPDLFWIKNRQASENHYLNDSVMGTSSLLRPNLTSAAVTTPSYVQSFDLDGITFQSSLLATQNYVGWAWKGAEIPAINSNGSIPSVVSANPAAGFSIVSWNGNASTATIGHGLGSAPKMIITKARNVAATRWNTFHASVGTGKYLSLETANAASTFALAWPTLPDENVWYMSSWENYTGENYISYVFAEVAGFSKFGSYSGQSTNKSIDLGFEPAFVMIKNTTIDEWWAMADNKRLNGVYSNRLYANRSDSESISDAIEFSGNTIIVKGNNSNVNLSGSTFIYMAFANQF